MPREFNLHSLGTGVAAAGLTALLLLGFAFYTSPPTRAARDCTATAKGAIQQALSALSKNDPASDRDALACTLAALVALDARLQGLSDGSIPFDGRIYIPHGYVFSKPPTEEAD